MDVIKSRREERIKRTAEIKATILKAFGSGLTLDKDKLIAEACLEWGTSRRFVQELVDLLRISVGFTIENKQIIPPKDEKE